jgi:hypothetical protein
MTQSTRRVPILPCACAVVAAILGFLPLAEWIPGGHSAEWYPVVAGEWISGSMIGVGVPIVAFIVLRRLGIWPAGVGERLASHAAARPALTATMLGLTAFAGYAAIALLVFDGLPLTIDEIVQVMQARIFAAGEVSRPVPQYPEFFGALNVVQENGRMFGQFPIGGPLMLLPGVLVGATWVTGPVMGACSAVLCWLLVREVEPRPAAALGASVLFAAAPFTAFMAGSHMNHVHTLAWLLLAMWCLVRVTRGESRALLPAFACGFALGMAAAVRPVDGAAFALPAAVWLLARGLRRPALLWDVVAAGAGIAIPASAILAFNALTTGDPLLFGYEILWGTSHRLGFHEAPWGAPHTPARGLEIANLMFLRLQTYLFESPVPSLVPVIAALALTPRVRGFDRYLLWSSVLLVIAYFAYFFDGYFLGPRFAYPLLPALALWTARLPGLARDRLPSIAGADRFVLLAYATSLMVALAAGIPIRVAQYVGGLTSMRFDFVAPAAARGIRDALILVRESWGAQLMARMWGLSVPRSAAELLYDNIDACLLEETLARLERAGVTGPAATDTISLLLRDSARVVESDKSPDTTERMLPGLEYGVVCRKRVSEDRAGYTFIPPILATDPGSNVYARELHARDTLLLKLYPSRPVYVLRAVSSEMGARLELFPFSMDSAQADWALSELGQTAERTRGPWRSPER